MKAHTRRAPIRAVILSVVFVVNLWIMATHFDSTLWFITHEDHKVRVFASLSAHSFIRNDQRRSRRDDFRDAVDDVLRYIDTVERRPRGTCIWRHRIGIGTVTMTR